MTDNDVPDTWAGKIAELAAVAVLSGLLALFILGVYVLFDLAF